MRRWLKLHTVIRTNPKVRRLPDDAARWHYVLLLVAAREASPEGEWLSDDYFLAAVDPATAERLPLFIEAELVARLDDGRIVVPNYDDWQASDRELSRARRDADSDERIHEQWREASRRYRDKKKGTASYDASSPTSKEVRKEKPSMTAGFAPSASGAPVASLTILEESQVPEGDRQNSDCAYCAKPVVNGVWVNDGLGPEPAHRDCLPRRKAA